MPGAASNASGKLTVAAGAKVHLHQAFRCCPYAGTVTSQVHDFLEQNRYTLVASPEQADVHVINTCGSDSRQAQQTFDAIDRIKQASPSKPVVITGCLCSIEPARLEAALQDAPHALLDPRHLSRLDRIFDSELVSFEAVPPEPKDQYVGEGMNTGYFRIIAGIGCFGRCSFCAIRRATGAPRSESIARVLEDVARGMKAGWRDFLLVHTDLSTWGSDIGKTPIDLLGSLLESSEGTLFSVVSFEPTLFLKQLPELLPLFASGRFSYLSVPIQSGAQRILDSMRRTYRIEAVTDAVQAIREAAPDVVLQTDVIYGFGDETEAEFEQSIVSSRVFDVVSFNPYQPRPGTPPRQIDDDVMSHRRQAVMLELRRRANEPGRALRRVVPLADSAQAAPDESPRPHRHLTVLPNPEPERPAWHQVTSERFARVLSRRGPIQLGGGWQAEQVRTDAVRGSAILTCRGPRDAGFELMLFPPDYDGALLARSERFGAAVLGECDNPPPDRDHALRTLLSLLGLG